MPENGTSGGSAEVVPEIINDRQLAAIRPDGTRRIYRVSGPRGLRFDVRATGARTWVMRYKTRTGRPRTHVLGRYPEMTLAEARAEGRRVRALVDLGKDPLSERLAERQAAKAAALQATGERTIEVLGRRCVAALPPASRKERLRLLEHDIIPALGHRQAAELTRAEIRAWASRIARRAPVVANRAFELLRRIYSWSIGQDLLEATPFVLLDKPSEEEASDRVLSAEEIRVLCLACARRDGQYEHAVRLLLLTGVRQQMVVGMSRAELEALDGPEPRWVIPAQRTKGKRPWVVPLSTQAVAIIRRRLSLAAGAHLFPPLRKEKGRARPLPTMRWSSKAVEVLRAEMERIRVAEAVEAEAPKPEPIPRWTIHNLRHTVATHLREDLGVDEVVAALIIGHKPPGRAGATRIYQRAELLGERRAALQRWADWLDGLV